MPIVKRSAPAKADKIQEEEENKEAADEVGQDLPPGDIVQPRRKPSRQESVDSFQSSLSELPSPSIIETVKSNEPFRFSLLPPIPDDLDSMFAAADAPATIEEEPSDAMYVNDIQESSPGADSLTNPFEDEAYLKEEAQSPARFSFDISTLPPPPPAPASNEN